MPFVLFFAQWPNVDSTTHPTGEPSPPANTGNWAIRPNGPAYIPQGQGCRSPEVSVLPEKGSACPQEAAAQTGRRHCPPPGCNLGQMTQCGASAIAARCIGHRSTLHGHMQHTAFGTGLLCHPHCVHLPDGVRGTRLPPSECSEAKKNSVRGEKKRSAQARISHRGSLRGRMNKKT